jgi:Mrp family chromosome partitioning ATPase
MGRRIAELDSLRGEPSPEFHPAGGRAAIPSRASSPKVARTVVAAGLIGITLGAIAAFVLQAVDPRLRREGQLRERFRLPVLTRVPSERAGRRRKAPLMPVDLSAQGTEAYRSLRRTIEAMPGTLLGPRSILIAGTSKGEGKTTTAINLASAFAAAGRSAILLPGDLSHLSHPSLARSLEPAGARSSDDVGGGTVTLEDAMVTTEGTDGRRVLAGPADGEAGSSRQPADVPAEAQAMADVVIVDAPSTADVSLLLQFAHHVDAIVLVARLNHTRLQRLRDLADTLHDNRLQPAGTVVVGVPAADDPA